MAKRGPKRKPNNEVSKIALYYRARREAQKNGTYIPKKNYTPALDKSVFDKYHLELKPSDNIFGWDVYYKGKPRPIMINSCGYAYITAYDKAKYDAQYAITKYRGGYQSTLLLHRLIYVNYIGPIAEGETVDHIDGNKLNNNLENLQILTREENVAKRFKNIV